MPALVVTHTASEGPGRLADWLTEAGIDLQLVEPWRGELLPETLEGFQALVVMGGPQQAWDDSSASWLRQTKQLMGSAIAEGQPVLGICLGGQLLAEAAGGRVQPGQAGPELGAKLVGKRDVAGADPLMWDLPLASVVVQWHWDAVVELPPGSTLLMSSTAYPHQAFRVGESAWGLQFHIEADAAMVARWVEADRAELERLGVDPARLLDSVEAELDEVAEIWGEVARRFARFALER